jgi:DNA helicase-2/ATP-dependent DNA helicase PcrA
LLPDDLRRSREASAAGKKKARGAAVCRQCGGALTGASEKKLGRCGSCPASYDEALFDALRAWRLERATADKVPAYVVCTDATLQLIAEHRPTTETALLKINGIGASKLEKYGADLLAVLREQG